MVAGSGVKAPVATVHRPLNEPGVAEIARNAIEIEATQAALIAAGAEQCLYMVSARAQLPDQIGPNESRSAGDKTVHGQTSSGVLVGSQQTTGGHPMTLLASLALIVAPTPSSTLNCRLIVSRDLVSFFTHKIIAQGTDSLLPRILESLDLSRLLVNNPR